MNNHLGNVLVTVNDRKIGVDNGVYELICPPCHVDPEDENVMICPPCYLVQSSDVPDGQTDYYMADVVNANDYYPFGMLMPGRSYTNGSGYRYGFNGKENDNEVKGEGNQQDYGFRIYDPRVGRFLSVDPITGEYPELTPYQFASNTPIQAKDLDGLEADFGNQAVNFITWLFADDVENVKQGSSTTRTGVFQGASGNPARSSEYTSLANNSFPDFTYEQQNAIRTADGYTKAIGGVGQLLKE